MMTISELFEQAQTVKELTRSLQDYFKQYAITSISLTYYSQHIKTGRKLVYDWVTKPLKPWHDYYLEQGYADVDRTLEKSAHAELPLFWDVHEQLLVAKNAREKRIRLESIEYGIDKGLSMPVHTPQGDIIMVVLHQRVGEQGLCNYKSDQFEWLGVLHHFAYFMRQLLTETSTTQQQLTKREKQCLELTAQSLRVESIAKQLQITPRTVNFHLQNANKKLGTNNKYQAVIKWMHR